jgi:hypothetical protein
MRRLVTLRVSSQSFLFLLTASVHSSMRPRVLPRILFVDARIPDSWGCLEGDRLLPDNEQVGRLALLVYEFAGCY